jgi:hypothetical protein
MALPSFVEIAPRIKRSVNQSEVQQNLHSVQV